jgi:hypothetical protein
MLGWRRFEGKKYDRTAVMSGVRYCGACLDLHVPLVQLFIPAAIATSMLVGVSGAGIRRPHTVETVALVQ